MGLRLAGLQNYFTQAGPLIVSSRIGSELSSGFSMLINGLQQTGEDGILLMSDAGEIILNEEEIYRISPVNPDGSFSLFMDGGTELTFAPAGVPVTPQFLG